MLGHKNSNKTYLQHKHLIFHQKDKPNLWCQIKLHMESFLMYFIWSLKTNILKTLYYFYFILSPFSCFFSLLKNRGKFPKKTLNRPRSNWYIFPFYYCIYVKESAAIHITFFIIHCIFMLFILFAKLLNKIRKELN